MTNTTRATKTSTSTKKATAKTASRATANGKMSTTELLRVYFVRPYPKFRSSREIEEVRQPSL